MKVGIVGSGPAGIFCAYELVRLGHEVVVFDQGRPLMGRTCPDVDCRHCEYQKRCSILCGEGGSGGFSDGKVTLSTGRGVQRDEWKFGRFPEALERLDEICSICASFAVRSEPVERPAILEGSPFEFESYPLLYLGTTGVRNLMHWMRLDAQREGAIFRYDCEVKEVFARQVPKIIYRSLHRPVKKTGRPLSTYHMREEFDSIVLASGSFGSGFMRDTAWTNGVALDNHGAAGIGIRLETDEAILEPLMKEFYDFKLYLTHPFDGLGRATVPLEYRTFCVNRGGRIVNERRPGPLVSINGRSDDDATGRSNLAIIVKLARAKEIVWHLAGKANLAGGGLPICQSVASYVWEHKRQDHATLDAPRSNVAVADLNHLWPTELNLGFQMFLIELNEILPGVMTDPNSLIYAPEIKYHMPKWPLGLGCVVEDLPKLQVIGNATGLTDSFSTAAASGLIAAQWRNENG